MVISGSQRSKEDDVQKISTSVFVTNFPDGYGAMDLWNTCKLYGHVVDVFIPDRRIKAGKVKEFASLTNLKVVLGTEGYVNIELKYMGGFWVMIVFQDDDTKKRFQFNLAVEVEGVSCKWWSRNTFIRIASRWGTLLNEEELEEEGYHSNRICIRTKLKTVVFDSFKMVYRGMTCWVRVIEVPGWVPDFEEDGEEGYDVNDGSHKYDMYGGVSKNLKDVKGESDREEVPETNFEEVPDKSIFEGNSVRQNNVHFEDPFDIYKVLNKKRDGKNIDDKHEDSLKYPHGFLPNEEGDVPVENVDNYGKRILIISVYAPQDLSEKKMLWDYLSFVIGNWDGEDVIMGDFNEVCDISERFGSIFNKRGAETFNSFIVNAGLVEVPLGGCSFTCNFMNKLKYLKEKIRIWARLHKKSLNNRKSILKAELADLDVVIDKGEGSDADGHRRREVVRLIQEVEKVDAMEVAQKAKIKWTIKGDENSKYYHGMLNKKRGRLTIRGILVDGIWMESPHLVKHEFFEHLKKRFEKPNKNRILLERDFVKRISLEQNDDLEREVSNEEIKRAVWDCGIDKAPGPDGFTFEIPKGGNSSFITLIPKAPNANMVKDFRPISLIGSLYKVIAKILANRLVTIFDDILDEIQSAFVTDRQILDGPFILNEIVHWCSVLERNGGDPLSPNLFILVMESLHVSFQRMVDAILFNGIKLDSSLQISHLFYVDDAIFTSQWSQCNIDTIIRVLDVFYRASGLRINMNKSNLMGISVDSNKVKHAAAKIGCLVLKTLFNYLGSRVGDLMSRIQSWHDVTEGMHTRLSKWKLKTLSIGGQLTLLKFVLGAIPIYHMSIFKVPMKVLQNMESIRARFFNGADVNSQKPSWVRWKSVLIAKDVGGLGVSSLFALNRALMFKWVWRFFNIQ
nr:RNA-directed DNA polymerase, eukaryota [Tanacetum cinerariifolium]